MHIVVHCPSCGSPYQLDPGLRGKRIRCPNAICRAVFEVREDNERSERVPEVIPPPAPPPPKPSQPASPSVVDSLPILEAEVVVPAPVKIDGPVYKLDPVDGDGARPEPGPREVPAWQQPP